MKPTIVFLSPNRNDAADCRRIDQFKRAGARVVVFAFRRGGGKTLPGDGVTEFSFGTIQSGYYLNRIPRLIAAFVYLVLHRRAIRRAKVVMARNLDLLLLAVMLKIFGICRAEIVYEVLDIGAVLLGNGLVSKAMRSIESALLRQVALLVISSDEFRTMYFERIHASGVPTVLLENRIYLDGFFAEHPEVEPTWRNKARAKPDFDPNSIQIGWVGALRCEKSAGILRAAARALKDKITVHIIGYPTYCSDAALREFFATEANVRFWGRYRYPDDLLKVYAALDLNWCIDLDFSDTDSMGLNAEWLLPNRLYEGGYFGVPQLGLANSYTGRTITDLGVGWVFKGDLTAALIDLLLSLDERSYRSVKERCLSLMEMRFHYQGDINVILRTLR